MLRSGVAQRLLLLLFQLIQCVCLCTHGVVGAGGSGTTGKEEPWGGSADPILILPVNILVGQTFLLLCVMSVQSNPLPVHRQQQLSGVSSAVFHWGILPPGSFKGLIPCAAAAVLGNASTGEVVVFRLWWENIFNLVFTV